MSSVENQLKEKGWILTPHAFDKKFVNQALAMRDDVESQHQHWSEISGGYQQCDLLKYKSSKFLNLFKQIENRAKVVLNQSGVDTTNYIARHFKLLLAEPGSGPQAPHRDGLDKNQYVVAVYLNHNYTTDVCSLPYLTQDLSQLTSDEKSQISPDYWHQLVNFKTKPGDMMIFAEDVIHRGVLNQSNQTRSVLFCVVGADNVYHTDNYQHFEWNWAEECSGYGSPEHLNTIQSNRQYHPIRHEKRRQRQRKLRQLLSKHLYSLKKLKKTNDK